MRKIFPLCAIGAAMLAALATGCNEQSKKGLEFFVVEGGGTYRLFNSAREFGTDEDITFTDSVSIMLPNALFENDVRPLYDSILKVAFDTVGTDYDGIVAKYMTRTIEQFGYNFERVDSVNPGTEADGFNTVSGTLVNLTPDLLVYSVSTSDYQPRAAHGLTTTYYINYDIRGGRVLSFNDLFDAGRADSLAAAIQTQADALEQVIGPTTIASLPAGNNFMLSPGGEIVFVYQPYEVASYAQGAIRISFYPYELVEYMTPFAIKYFNLSDLN